MGEKQKTEGEKKIFFKVYTKFDVIRKEIWVLVFSFMYLVSVDPMDRQKNRNSGFVKTCDEYAHSPESSEKLIRMWKNIAPFFNLFKWDTGEVAS